MTDAAARVATWFGPCRPHPEGAPMTTETAHDIACPVHGRRRFDLAGPEPMCGECRVVGPDGRPLGWADGRMTTETTSDYVNVGDPVAEPSAAQWRPATGGVHNPSAAQVPPEKMTFTECQDFAKAANLVKTLFTGETAALGEIIARELQDWQQFGYRASSTGLMLRAVAAVRALQVEQRKQRDRDRLCRCEPARLASPTGLRGPQ